MEGEGQKDMRLVMKHWTLAWGQGKLFNGSEVWTTAEFEPVFTNCPKGYTVIDGEKRLLLAYQLPSLCWQERYAANTP